jgi:hypothetical protein
VTFGAGAPRVGVLLDVVAVGHQQHLVKGNRFAFGRGQFFDPQDVALGHFVLFAAGFDYCVHALGSVWGLLE